MVKKIFIAVRPFSFVATFFPVTVGAMLAENFSWSVYLLSLLASILIHAGVNTTNDYFDFLNGLDTKDSMGSSGLITSGKSKPKEILLISIISYILSVILGILLINITKNFNLIWFGLIGIILGYGYTGKPFNLKYKALGIPLVFLLMGPLMVLGSYFAQTESLSIDALLLSIPVGIATVLILLANEIRDIEHDKNAGAVTLPIILGEKRAINLYIFLTILIYIFITILWILGVLNNFAFLTLLSIKIYVDVIKKMKNYSDKKEIAMIDQMSAMGEMILTVTMIISLI
ncbi:1,4-dihydroxy-2-naphthoate octaprenyltransferase [Marinitoga litoralis]|uniref:1,4-dihydroxy-2-naphthoate octaprenyltransferase n=1 Tax=Marinitoga litoralis TaxID=570855 RepID=UPI001960804A|nr:1,4-dihydroxy-2-naphthoate octaprenyltransferase [Marinitoga litoralis]